MSERALALANKNNSNSNNNDDNGDILNRYHRHDINDNNSIDSLRDHNSNTRANEQARDRWSSIKKKIEHTHTYKTWKSGQHADELS